MLQIADIVQCGAAEAQALVDRWRENGIAGVVCVAHNVVPEVRYDPWLPVLRHPHADETTPDPPWFEPILAFYDWARTRGKVLVHCQAGGNRSVGTTGVILVARHGMGADAALAATGLPGHAAWIEAVRRFAARAPVERRSP